MKKTKNTKNAYIVGGGIAGLSSAAYLIKDGKMSGKDIYILESTKINGGSMDGAGDEKNGYVIRGGRMFTQETYTCMYDLLSFIPSIKDPSKTVKEEIFEFNKEMVSCSKSRLLDRKRQKIDVKSMGFNTKDRRQLTTMLATSEKSLGKKKISDRFGPHFFETNFWYMRCTTFAFQPWHSAVEFKRYLHRFIQEFPRIETLGGVWRSRYNQYDAIILPIITWLEKQGVNFLMNSKVTDIIFKPQQEEIQVKEIHYTQNNEEKTIEVDDNDYVFTTIGSMTAGATLGSMTTAPKLNTKKTEDRLLWEKMAKGHPELGNPKAFDESIDDSLWESFTVTCKDPTFFDLMEEFTTNKPGTGGLVTFKDSNRLMSVVLAHQPHFLNQPKNIQVFRGYGLFPNKIGNFVNKKMSECTGEEILTELCHHLKFEKEMKKIVSTSICIPCMMPYITSQFLIREKSDRPLVIPKNSKNLVLLGQFCEIPDDVVFTVEYSVRAAQIAVTKLFNTGKKISPIYKGGHKISVLRRSLKTMFR